MSLCPKLGDCPDSHPRDPLCLSKLLSLLNALVIKDATADTLNEYKKGNNSSCWH